MKLKAIVIGLLLTLASSSFAQFFPANPNVIVLPGQVSAQVYNPYFQPIICNGQVFGQTAFGQVYTAFFAEQFMPSGTSRHAFVLANGFNPFVTGWANIHCRFFF